MKRKHLQRITALLAAIVLLSVLGTAAACSVSQDNQPITEVTQEDGVAVITTTNADGSQSIDITFSATTVESAKQQCQALVLPIPPIQAATNADAATPITIHVEGDATAEVYIPVVAPTASTVLLTVNEDGSTEIIKKSVLSYDNLSTHLQGSTTLKVIDNHKTFVDVPPDSEYELAITAMAAKELLIGISATEFAPNSPLTQAMLFTALARLDGVDTAGGEAWYSKSIKWAVQKGFCDGTKPNAYLTREQMVAVLWQYVGAPVPEVRPLYFRDAELISSYTWNAVLWAAQNGIVPSLQDGCFCPHELATRAQFAQLLQDLIQKNDF